jgi:holo-[acyl-carrier protein] synthase
MPSLTVEMPFQVGIDLVCAAEVEEAVRIHGRGYLERIYSEEERADSGTDPVRLAACFAAKEATMKALRSGDEALGWRTIGVYRDGAGRPSLRLTGAAQELAERIDVQGLSVSLTHQGDLAAAVVLAEVGTLL